MGYYDEVKYARQEIIKIIKAMAPNSVDIDELKMHILSRYAVSNKLCEKWLHMLELRGQVIKDMGGYKWVTRTVSSSLDSMEEISNQSNESSEEEPEEETQA